LEDTCATLNPNSWEAETAELQMKREE
jgi:hypothetical protein